MNSAAGLIMAVIMSVFIGLAFMPNSPIFGKPEVAEFGKQYAFFGGVIIAFGISMSNTCTVGISIEGKNFWLIKSLPINYKKYMWAKILLSLILILPVSLISSTVIVLFIMPDWQSILAIYFVPIFVTLFNVFVGLLINLSFYKLRWTNEQEVVKSSTAVWLSMLVGFLSVIIIAGLLATGMANKTMGVFITIGAGALASAITYLALSQSFERKLNNIEDF
jgi:ABC-2 type transport system permease protein